MYVVLYIQGPEPLLDAETLAELALQAIDDEDLISFQQPGTDSSTKEAENVASEPNSKLGELELPLSEDKESKLTTSDSAKRSESNNLRGPALDQGKSSADSSTIECSGSGVKAVPVDFTQTILNETAKAETTPKDEANLTVLSNEQASSDDRKEPTVLRDPEKPQGRPVSSTVPVSVGGPGHVQDIRMQPDGDKKTVSHAVEPNENTAQTPVHDQSNNGTEVKKAKPRRPPNPFLKAARQLLNGKVDLAVCLSPEDCTFLADNFWIFTVDQLSYYLDSPASAAVKEDSAGIASRNKSEEFLCQVAISMKPSEQNKKRTKRNIDPSGEPTLSDKVAVEIPNQVRDEKDIGKGESVNMVDQDSKIDPTNQGVLTSVAGEIHVKPESVQPVARQYNEDAVNNEKSSATNEDKTTPSRKVLDTTKQEAADRLRQWTDALRSYKIKAQTQTPQKIEESFRLDGAIKTLLPLTTQHFLKSVNVETAWGFLSLRKQENAPVCEVMKQWRVSTGSVKEASAYILSKYLCGIAARIETALTSIPSVSIEDREWMNGPINCLSGAARDFVVFDQGLKTIPRFLGQKTKDLSQKLEAWRKEKGMTPLKGSGKVAMVSSWKTFSKDILEIETHTGRVLDMTSQLAKHTIDETNNENHVRVKKPRKKRSRKEQSMLLSSDFFVGALGQNIVQALANGGIQNAEQLLEVSSLDVASLNGKSQLIEALVRSGAIDSASSCHDVLSKWATAVKLVHAEKTRQKSSRKVGKDDVVNIMAAESSDQPKPPPIKVDVQRQRKALRSADPFQALSNTTKEFLRSIDISTAEVFLSSRSTDIAVDFIKWRVSEGKPELKGCGAVASVSGWKTIVRKRAQEIGL